MSSLKAILSWIRGTQPKQSSLSPCKFPRLGTFSLCHPYVFRKISAQILFKNPHFFYWFFSYIVDINPLPDIWFTNIFSHLVHCPFILLTVSFAVKNLSGLCSPFVYFCICCLCFWSYFQSIIAKTRDE